MSIFKSMLGFLGNTTRALYGLDGKGGEGSNSTGNKSKSPEGRKLNAFVREETRKTAKKLLEKINFISDVLIIADNRSFVSALLFVDDIAIGNLQKQIFSNSSIADFINSQLLLEIINNKIKQINQELDHWENIRKFIVINSFPVITKYAFCN